MHTSATRGLLAQDGLVTPPASYARGHMTSPALSRLIALCPPPPRPQNARGDRGAARAAGGWDIPDHVFEVTETYGDVTWMDWLLVPSPHSPAGIQALLDRAGDSPNLLAFSDPEEALLFIGADGKVSVSSAEGVTETGRSLAEVLLAWLEETELFGLPPHAELSNASDVPPFAVPFFDDARTSRVTWVYVKGGPPSRQARWAPLLASLGPHVRMSVVGEGEKRQDKVHVPALELNLIFDTINAPEGMAQLHMHHYLDRQHDVKAALASALSAAGMQLDRVEGPRGAVDW